MTRVAGLPAPVTVVVPVYEAFAETERCLGSVLAATPPGVRVLVVDDASPGGALADYLPEAVRRARGVTILRNRENLGFVGTCNRAMLVLAGDDDVVLLNSDTVVTPGWLGKLASAAYSRPRVGTVTPLTNNGTICSVPRFLEDNPLPRGYGVDAFAALVERESASSYPELPTCVGFCTYVRRELLDEVGGFDAETFGKGYGEENDLSCRGRAAGFVDLLDDRTFVYHEGSMSFGAEKGELTSRNSDALAAKHPGYFPAVAAFCAADPLRPVRERIAGGLLADVVRSGTPSVLHVLHNGPKVSRSESLGGTELHVQDLMRTVDSAAHWSLVPRAEGGHFLTYHHPSVDREFVVPPDGEALGRVLSPEVFDSVHVHHTMGFDRAALVRALAERGRYTASLHDFYSICPRIFLVRPDGDVCDRSQCVSHCGYGTEEISRFRVAAHDLLRSAERVVVFSKVTADLVSGVTGEGVAFDVVPHGIDPLLRPRPIRGGRRPDETPFRVAFVGRLASHKGLDLVGSLVAAGEEEVGRRFEWHLIGESDRPLGAGLAVHGRYERGRFAEAASAVDPDVVCLLSVCPETYSFTLDEAWNAGYPVVVTPYGAPAERVTACGAGWVATDVTPAGVRELLTRIASDPDDYAAKAAAVARAPLVPLGDEAEYYARLFDRRTGARPDLLVGGLA